MWTIAELKKMTLPRSRDTSRVKFSLHKDVHQQLQYAAEKSGLYVSEIIELLVREGLPKAPRSFVVNSERTGAPAFSSVEAAEAEDIETDIDQNL